MDQQAVKHRRDLKAREHLGQYAPIWLIDEKFFDEDEALQFNVVFQHNLYGWVSRRYRYDGFNDVLYHKGQTTISEEKSIEIQQQEPYLAGQITDMPNAYGG